MSYLDKICMNEKNGTRWTEKEDQYLRNNYLIQSEKEITNNLVGRTWNAIISRAIILNIGSRRSAGLVRKYTFNYNYFNKINTEEKSYWLGFIYADGCVDTHRDLLRISLVTEGEKHLKKFAKAIQYTGTVAGPRFMKWKYKGIKRESKYYSLEIGQREFIKDLSNLGVIPNKTYCVKFPNIPINLRQHFIRGVFDGDGCISRKTTKYKDKIYTTPSMSLVGAVPEFLECIVKIFSTESGVKQASVVKRKTQGQTYMFSYQGNPSLRIRDWLYQDATIYMDCKKEKFFSWA